MRKNNKELRERLYALRVVEFVKSLPRTWVALEIGKQLLHSGTSVDANYEEAYGTFSKADFTYKLNTAFKEAKESNYWLQLLRDSKIVTGPRIEELIQESKEIRNILGTGVRTAKKGKK